MIFPRNYHTSFIEFRKTATYRLKIQATEKPSELLNAKRISTNKIIIVQFRKRVATKLRRKVMIIIKISKYLYFFNVYFCISIK